MFHPDLKEPTAVLLKQQTAQTHAELEELLVPQIKNVGSLEDYSDLLKLFYGYFQPLEILIESRLSESQLPDLLLRRKAAFIRRDLHHLGLAKMNIDIATDLPHIQNNAAAFGALYVLEGSTLGGRGILKMLQKSLPELSPFQLSFFNGYGQQTGQMWTTFQYHLNEFGTAGEIQEEITAAANETFIKFKQWIIQAQAA